MRWLRNLFARRRPTVHDDTEYLPVLYDGAIYDYRDEPDALAVDEWWSPAPDAYGWSASIGWHYDEKWEWIVAGWDPTPLDSPIFTEMGGDRVLAGGRPQLAIESGRPRELEAAK